jgi:hypothetical protein
MHVLPASASCAFVSSAGWTFTLRSFRWPLSLSARALWMTCVSDSLATLTGRQGNNFVQTYA